MSVMNDLLNILSKLPVGAIAALYRIVKNATASDDPERYLKRIAYAEALHKATQAKVKKQLEEKE